MRVLLRVGLALLATLLALVAVLVGRALTSRSVQVQAPPVQVEVDATRVAGHLAEAIRFPTVSGPLGTGSAPFALLHRWMADTWPAFHAVAARETFPGPTLLYRWKGSDPSLEPVMFLAHTDVVPVEPETLYDWTWAPFAGAVAPCPEPEDRGHVAREGDCVWGRGAVDMKSVLVALLEAADALAAQGWAPRRTLLFAFGHDEEVGGTGVQAVAEALAAEGVRLAWSLDEGLVITDGLVPGLAAPAALVGIAEKGYLSVELVVEGEGGHSSMPPPQTAVGVLAAAVARVEANPLPAGLDGPVGFMFDALGPEMPFGTRLAFANRWLLGPVVLRQLAASRATNAVVRTTTAVTMIEGGTQDNVLPQHARAVVNFRLHPRDSVDGVLEHVRQVLDDPRVEVRALQGTGNREPSDVSDASGPGYRAVERAVRGVFPDVLVAPNLFVAATDSRHLGVIARERYRFQPNWMRAQERELPHGTDERVRIDNLADYVRFYTTVMREAGG